MGKQNNGFPMMHMSYYMKSMHIYYATWQVGIKTTDGIKVAHQLKRLPWMQWAQGNHKSSVNSWKEAEEGVRVRESIEDAVLPVVKMERAVVKD